MSALIFSIEPGLLPSGKFSLDFSDRELIENIALERAGERTALGTSDLPGIWTIHATGTLRAIWRSAERVHLDISDLVTLPAPVEVVTAGDRYADTEFSPYVVDVLEDDAFSRVFGSTEAYEQQLVPRALAAEEAAGANFLSGMLYGGLHLDPQGPKFFHGVAAAYQWRCAFTGMCQASPDGRFQEGVVIGVDEPYEFYDAPPAQGLYVSNSVAFCYRHGLLAIGEDYDILRHPKLGAEMRIFLEMVNRRALLIRPDDAYAWPDLDAARRHRQRFGF